MNRRSILFAAAALLLTAGLAAMNFVDAPPDVSGWAVVKSSTGRPVRHDDHIPIYDTEKDAEDARQELPDPGDFESFHCTIGFVD